MSKIQWTQQTWNPIIGCSKKSLGCENCYAEKMAARLARIGKTAYYGEVVQDEKWNGNISLIGSQLKKPMERKKPTTYFVGSMTDLFHKATPIQHVNKVFFIMGFCSQHRFIVLTKRPEMMQMYMGFQKDFCERHNFTYPLPNVILGVTTENQEQADKRIPILLETPAAARFVSIEPMLGAVDLTEIAMWNGTRESVLDRECWGNCACGLTKLGDEPGCKRNGGDGKLANLDWVICGGESGPGARPMHPDWVRSLRDQCKSAGVPFFFKQWGEWKPWSRKQASHMIRSDSGHVMNYVTPAKTTDDFWEPVSRVGKKKAGNLLDGQVYEQYPAILREVQDG